MMSSIVAWLSTGDLRTDGAANEVADLVLQNPDLIKDLMEALHVSDDVVRGHAADALDKVARSLSDLLIVHLDEIVTLAMHDEVPMVRWHLAMILGYLSFSGKDVDKILDALLYLLDDASVFVRSWSIVSLCIIARIYPQHCETIITRIEPLKHSESVAIRTKVRQSLNLLLNPQQPFPNGWIKSEHPRNRVSQS